MTRDSSPGKMFFLLKARLTRPRRPAIPAKTSMLREALVLLAALILGAAILLLVLSHFHHS